MSIIYLTDPVVSLPVWSSKLNIAHLQLDRLYYSCEIVINTFDNFLMLKMLIGVNEYFFGHLSMLAARSE